MLILQRQQGGLDTCQLSGRIADSIDRYFSPRFELAQSLFGICQLLLRLQQYLLGFSALGFHLVERVCIGHHQIHVFGCQTILAQFQLRKDFQRIRFACLFNCLSLLRGAHFVLAGPNHIGRLTQLFFKRWHVIAHNLGTLAGFAYAVDAAGQFAMPAIEFICRRFSIGLNFGDLHPQCGDLRGQATSVVAEVINLLFQLHNLGVCLEHRGLCVSEFVGFDVMVLAQFIQLSFDLAQSRGFAFKSRLGLDDFVGVAFFGCLYFALLGVSPQVFVKL